MPPLIKIKLLLNDTLEISGIYDSCLNVSLINSKLLKIQKKLFHTYICLIVDRYLLILILSFNYFNLLVYSIIEIILSFVTN